jgi:hypothetical protein
MKSELNTSAANIADSITVLFTQPGYTASKTITRNASGGIEIKDFNAGMYFGVLDLPPVDGIHSLSNYLTQLETIENVLVIRGEPLPHVSSGQSVHRRKVNFLTPKHGRRWVMLDVDKYPLPKRLASRAKSHAAVAYVVSKLPREFHDVTYHWSFSSSTGFKGADTVSVHIWFWLDAPISDMDLTRWAHFVNFHAGLKLIDFALFRDVQAHYTAAPRFVGMKDPLPIRSGLCVKARDAVEIQLPTSASKVKSARALHKARGERAPSADTNVVGFENRLACIGDHAGGQGFYIPLLNAAASYAATYGADETDIEALYSILHDAAMAADRRHHTIDEVVHRASREQIIPMIESALAKYGQVERTRVKTRLVKGIDPHYQANPVSALAANELIAALIEDALK